MDTDDLVGATGASTGDPHLPPDHSTQHLSQERLAALADDAASSDELRHLATCSVCADDVAAYQTLLTLTRAEHDRLSKPLTTWESLHAALRQDGLIAPLSASHSTIARLSTWSRNIAAAAVLVAGGVVLGRATSHADTGSAAGPVSASGPTQTIASPDSGAVAPAPDPGIGVAPVGLRFRNKDEAISAVLNAETTYRHAVAYLMLADSADRGQGIPYDYRTRLAVLDEVSRTTRAALYAAPHDPVLNNFYLNSVDAREATLRQLGRTLPTGLQGGKY